MTLNNGSVMDPTEEIFRFVFDTLQSMWQENLNSIKPLLSDQFFNTFTRPMINHKIEEPLCGDPPSFITIISKDSVITNFKNEVTKLLDKNFNAVKMYCKRFQDIEKFYKEDLMFDDNVIRENERCDIFRQWCNRYEEEEKEILKIVDCQPLGIFNVQLERFKDSALPAPVEKHRILEIVMPG